MGLFGFLGKAITAVAKAGLSTVTGGLSDTVFDALKHKQSQEYLSNASQKQLADWQPHLQSTQRGGRYLHDAGTADMEPTPPVEIGDGEPEVVIHRKRRRKRKRKVRIVYDE